MAVSHALLHVGLAQRVAVEVVGIEEEYGQNGHYGYGDEKSPHLRSFDKIEYLIHFMLVFWSGR